MTRVLPKTEQLLLEAQVMVEALTMFKEFKCVLGLRGDKQATNEWLISMDMLKAQTAILEALEA